MILQTSSLAGKVLTKFTLTAKNNISNEKFEKWIKELRDPLQPDKLASETMHISKHRNIITMEYKKPMIYNKLTVKIEEYRYQDIQSLERIDGS